MEVSVTTQENKNETEIIIETDKQEIAVIVRDKGGERIYLPHEIDKNNRTYYTDDNQDLEETKTGYRVLHPQIVENVNVIS